MSGLAQAAAEGHWAEPELAGDTGLDFREGRNPVAEALLEAEGRAFIANDCQMSDMGRLWLLTGPNMAGKSTFLRQVALIVLMAQVGSFVPAAHARIGVVDKLFSRIGASDDLAAGRSTFMIEMLETSAILNQATSRSLVILDEVGRGTSTHDGLAIAQASLEYLHDTVGCRTLFVILHGFRGSPALCVDRSGSVPMLGASGCRVHRTRHERALSHAGLPRRGDHAGLPQPASHCHPRHPAWRPMPGLRAREPCRAQPLSPACGWRTFVRWRISRMTRRQPGACWRWRPRWLHRRLLHGRVAKGRRSWTDASARTQRGWRASNWEARRTGTGMPCATGCTATTPTGCRAIAKFKQVMGDGPRPRTDPCRAAEVDVAVRALNRMLERDARP